MKRCLQLHSWLDQNIIDTVPNCKSLVGRGNHVRHAGFIKYAKRKEITRWNAVSPQMKDFDKMTPGELSKLDSAGPWKALILWLFFGGFFRSHHDFPCCASVHLNQFVKQTQQSPSSLLAIVYPNKPGVRPRAHLPCGFFSLFCFFPFHRSCLTRLSLHSSGYRCNDRMASTLRLAPTAGIHIASNISKINE